MEALIPTLPTPPTPDYSACSLFRFHAFFLLIILGYYDLPVTFVNACHSPCSTLCLSVTSYNSVFVLCCCITNEPKIKWLKTFLISQFFKGLATRNSFMEPSVSGSFTGCNQGAWGSQGWICLPTQGWVPGCRYQRWLDRGL